MENFNKNNIIPESGFSNGLKKFINVQKEILENIEGLPTKQETFTVPELKEIIQIKQNLDELIKELSSSNKNPNIEEKREQLDKVIKYLDALQIWNQKFSTGEKDDIDENNYSLYYVTDKNISLRIKKINLEKYSLDKIIEPFMENITFHNGIYYPTEKAIIDYDPIEYCSNDFYKLQSQDPNELKNDFISGIKKIYKDDKLYYVSGPTKDNLFHKHEGHEVNKIYFQNY